MFKPRSSTKASTHTSYLTSLLLASLAWTSPSLSSQHLNVERPRSAFLRDLSQFIGFGMSSANKPGFAIINADVGNEESVQSVTNRVIYKPITLDVLREKVPIATWYPSTLNGISSSDDRLTSRVIYEHGISVSKIGNKLAGWKFIPSFVTRNFPLTPTYTNIV